MRPAAPGHRAARPCGDARGLVAARAHGACSSGCVGLALPTAPLRAAGSSRSPLTLQGATHARVPQSPSPSPSQASPFPALPPPHTPTLCHRQRPLSGGSRTGGSGLPPGVPWAQGGGCGSLIPRCVRDPGRAGRRPRGAGLQPPLLLPRLLISPSPSIDNQPTADWSHRASAELEQRLRLRPPSQGRRERLDAARAESETGNPEGGVQSGSS